MPYKLLDAFEGLFTGSAYLHRNSTQGDRVASFLVDDMYALGRSPKLKAAVDALDLVLNVANKTEGLPHRRGDGTFGTLVPGEVANKNATYVVGLGRVANILLGAEVKILAKAMVKQIDRVGTDLINQATEFQKHGSPICVGIAGYNYADGYTSFEGAKPWPTDGKRYKHPIQEAAVAEGKLTTRGVHTHYDEFLTFRFIATNAPPHTFSWLDAARTNREYGSALVRLSARFEKTWP